MTTRHLLLAATLLLPVLLGWMTPGRAMEPPEPGMIDQMKAEGTYDACRAFADRLGTYKFKAALRGTPLTTNDPQGLADLIGANLGQSLNNKSGKAVSASTPQELSWAGLDLNYDRTVDERDVLALGFDRPKVAAGYPSLGTVKTFCVLLEYSDYPHWYAESVFDTNLFGAGDSYYYYRGLKYYYTQASYNQLTVDGDVFDWYEAVHPRTYYHPNDNNDYPDDDLKRTEMICEAINAADDAGTDFSQYDNDGDGNVDYFLVIYTGPRGAWSSFWWGYYGAGLPDNFIKDGVRFPTYSFQWEQAYEFNGSPPNPAHWDPKVTIHETGHALGLPDYYDYDGSQGPDGGVGGLDMMDGNWGDHNAFSKYILGWLTPTVAFTNLDNEQLQKSNAYGDPVIVMPGFDPVSPWSEYFIAQNRYKEGIDNTYPTSGMLIWHVDARVDRDGNADWDNSYAAHKLLRLMEADGLEEIENNGGADAGDFYDNTATTGDDLTPSSTPDSDKYDATATGITIDDISVGGANMTADFTLYSGSPPSVSITAPTAGAVVSGNATTVTVSATGGGTISKVQLLIDGLIVKEWTTWSSPQSYTWNTYVDYNGTRSLTARAWGDGSQVGSATITVTVTNAGLTSLSDDFEGGLTNFRVENVYIDPRGQQTAWDTRTSPANPTPKLSSGKEAWIKPGDSTNWFTAADILRCQRINATAYTRPLQLKFFYRCRAPFSLWVTTDNGATWTRREQILTSSGWSTFNRSYADLAGDTVYFALRSEGRVKESDNNGLGANIDGWLVREAPSNIPTVSWVNPSDGGTVTGNYTFTASASDDGSVAKVYFYLDGSLRSTDTSGPTWTYTRDSRNDDDHPGLEAMVIAEDNDGLASLPAKITVSFNNDRPYPVADDLEGGATHWSLNNDSKQPQWQLVTTAGHSGTQCMGDITASAWEANNSDWAYYIGDPPTAGRQTIDLSNASVDDPVLRFWYKLDMPASAYLRVYWYDTWNGTNMLANYTSDVGSWTEATIPLSMMEGYSGRIYFYFRTYTATAGATGVWIDDVRVENRGPRITGLSPARGVVGGTITVNGSGFGPSRDASYVTFYNGVQAAAGDYVSWSNNAIQVNIPSGAVTGDVTVTVGGITSNASPLTVVLSAPSLDGLGQL